MQRTLAAAALAAAVLFARPAAAQPRDAPARHAVVSAALFGLSALCGGLAVVVGTLPNSDLRTEAPVVGMLGALAAADAVAAIAELAAAVRALGPAPAPVRFGLAPVPGGAAAGLTIAF